MTKRHDSVILPHSALSTPSGKGLLRRNSASQANRGHDRTMGILTSARTRASESASPLSDMFCHHAPSLTSSPIHRSCPSFQISV